MKSQENYEPFGPQWHAEFSKLPKLLIIKMFKNVATELIELKQTISLKS